MWKIIIYFCLSFVLMVTVGCQSEEPNDPPEEEIGAAFENDNEDANDNDADSNQRSKRDYMDKEVGDELFEKYTILEKADLSDQDAIQQSGPMKVTINHLYVVFNEEDGVTQHHVLAYVDAQNTSNDAMVFDISAGIVPGTASTIVINDEQEIEQEYITDFVGPHFGPQEQNDIILWFPLQYQTNIESVELKLSGPFGPFDPSIYDPIPMSMMETLTESDKAGEDMIFQIEFVN